MRCRHRRGLLWARHAHADLADMRNDGQLATGERGGGVVLASQRERGCVATMGEGIVEAVDGGVHEQARWRQCRAMGC
ncbi:hypothetical protein ACLOJK_018916 [Asimina triloba]